MENDEQEKDLEDQDNNEGNNVQSSEPLVPSPKKGKRMLVFIFLGLLLIALLIPLILYFSGIIGNKNNEKSVKEAVEETIFLEMDEFLVNLDQGSNRQPSFLKMTIILQVTSQDIRQKLYEQIPVIRDSFQVYLRELRAEDLRGSGGIFRLKEELLLRINKIMYPLNVRDILFKEILVQ